MNDEKRMAQGFYRYVHFLKLIAAPGEAFDPFVGMTHRKLNDDMGYNACKGTQRVVRALYKRTHTPATGGPITLCVLTGKVIRGYLREAAAEPGKTGVGVLVRDGRGLCIKSHNSSPSSPPQPTTRTASPRCRGGGSRGGRGQEASAGACLPGVGHVPSVVCTTTTMIHASTGLTY